MSQTLHAANRKRTHPCPACGKRAGFKVREQAVISYTINSAGTLTSAYQILHGLDDGYPFEEYYCLGCDANLGSKLAAQYFSGFPVDEDTPAPTAPESEGGSQ